MAIPFGPFLALGGVVGMLAGDAADRPLPGLATADLPRLALARPARCPCRFFGFAERRPGSACRFRPGWIFSSSIRKVRCLAAVDEGLGHARFRAPGARRFREPSDAAGVAEERRDVGGDQHQRLLAVAAGAHEDEAGVSRLGSIVSSRQVAADGRLRPCSACRAGGDRHDPDVDRVGEVGDFGFVRVRGVCRSPPEPAAGFGRGRGRTFGGRRLRLLSVGRRRRGRFAFFGVGVLLLERVLGLEVLEPPAVVAQARASPWRPARSAARRAQRSPVPGFRARRWLLLGVGSEPPSSDRHGDDRRPRGSRPAAAGGDREVVVEVERGTWAPCSSGILISGPS